MEPTSTTEKRRPPVMSPVTFLRFMETHRRTLPTRIDRSLMANLSGGDQVNVLAALRSFDLIDVSGKPMPSFEALRDLDPDEFNAAWKGLLKRGYPALFDGSINLAAATHGELEEKFRGFGVSGDSIRKATSFFLVIARTAGVALSPHFKNSKSRSSNGTPRLSGRRRKTNGSRQAQNPLDAVSTFPHAQPVPNALQERLHRSVYGWIEELPPVGETWARDDFNSWLATLKTMLERLYRVAD